MESITGATKLLIKATGSRMKCLAKANSPPLTIEYLKALTKKANSMVRATISGPMEGPTKESTNLTKKMDMGFTNGPMVKCTKENGKMACSMAKAYSLSHQVYQNMVSGKMERELNGLIRYITLIVVMAYKK